ncbi:MAG: phosphoribosyl-AMP cyclohydrolase [Propylenella sp.]
MPAPREAPAAGIEESDRFTPRFDADGLIPCITVDAASGEVLMLAWMNEEALRRTLETGFAHYWSRSRRHIWKKGESSGALQRIVELSTDCDQDAILIRAEVESRAGTCHTGRATCFYRSVPLGAGPVERPFKPGDAAG